MIRFGELPMDPLFAYVGRRERQLADKRLWLTPLASIVDFARLERRTAEGERWAQRLLRASRTGWIRLEWAEDLCDLAGIHPTAVWGFAYYEAAPEPEWEGDDNVFCGRRDEWQSVGHGRWYGLHPDAERVVHGAA